MSGSDVGDAEAAGLMLLGGGLFEALDGMAATLATVQGVADRTFGILGPQADAVPAVPPSADTGEGSESQVALAPPAPNPVPDAEERFAVSPQDFVRADSGMATPAAPPPLADPARAEAAPPTTSVQQRVPLLFASFAPQVAGPAFESAAVPPSEGVSDWPEMAAPVADPVWLDMPAMPDPAAAAAAMTPPEPISAAPAASYSARPATAAPDETSTAERRSTRDGARSGPTQGDVFLDGVRVGTWLADHLARETVRPQSGGTGFDPRMTAPWPGTLQGG